MNSSSWDMPVAHPRERFLTVYGRMPVLEALRDKSLTIDKVLVAHGSRGENLRAITQAAAVRGLAIERVSEQRIKSLAGNGRHDQGVVADVVADRMRSLEAFIATAVTPRTSVLLLDSVTTPANVGMILRTATAADIDGIIVPQRGTAGIGPLVIKASAGIAFRAPILRARDAESAAQQLRDAGFSIIGLSADATRDVFRWQQTGPVAFVLGNETTGLSDEVAALLSERLSIPLANGVESLNVASAAAVLCFELARRR